MDYATKNAVELVKSAGGEVIVKEKIKSTKKINSDKQPKEEAE